MKAAGCDYCANYVYDDETETYYCDVNLDEDEYYRFLTGNMKTGLCATRCKGQWLR